MLLTIFLAIVFCAAMVMMLISCVAFIQDNKLFSSAPKEAREVLIDNFLLLKSHFFQQYYPEAAQAMEGRKYGFNIKSQLLKLFVIFPAVSALAAWICTLF